MKIISWERIRMVLQEENKKQTTNNMFRLEAIARTQLESCEEEIGEIFKEIAKLGDGDWGDKEINKLFRRWVQALKQKLGVK